MRQVKKVGRKTARGIVVHNNAILLLERWRTDKTGNQLHYYSIPGGGIEPGETPEVAVVRELFEETSILVRPVRAVAKQSLDSGDSHTYFLCQYLSGEPKLHNSATEEQTSDNRSEPHWVTKEQLESLALNNIYEPLRELLALAFGNKLPQKLVSIK